MDPVYKNMNSYPYHRDQMHYGPHCYPGAEAVPAQMFVNPARLPMNYECWPCGGNYGCGYSHASPMVCHGCCNHSYVPNHFAWRPPCSHVPPVQYPGNYPFSPAQYMPPPNYVMEQPRYEYEKNVPGEHHCCGCRNHPSHPKEQKNLKIEEEEPDHERKRSDSVVPFQFKNNKPFPIVWLPPDYNRSNEYWKPHNLEDRRDSSQEVKPVENQRSVQQQPTSRNGWYPIDLHNFIPSKQAGGGDMKYHEENDGKGRFPFPLFWIPYKPEGAEGEEHAAKDGSTTPRMESDKDSGNEQTLKKDGERIGRQTASRTKDIPVKEAQHREIHETSRNKEKERDALVKEGVENGQKKVDNGEKKVAEDGAKRKSSSPKSPKLPPVCLRVDPLPRRKGANGSSRSPSPRGEKQKLDHRSNDEAKKPNGISNNGLKADKNVTKTVDVVDREKEQVKSSDLNVEARSLPIDTHGDVSQNQTEEKPKDGSISQENAETNEAPEKGQLGDAEFSRNKEVSSVEVKETPKRQLSAEEAVVIIQSAYRGFETRRWEPIKKLKQIAKVREEIAKVTPLIQEMESSSDVQANSKQRNIISEAIMSLLLKLDTIQGLHPSIRGIRKAVVRELVNLQEKLDVLMNEKSEASLAQKSIERDTEYTLNKSKDALSSQDDNTTPSDLPEARESQLDGGSNSQNLEVSEANVIGEPGSETLDNKTAESCVTEAPKSASQDSEETTKNGDENEDLVPKDTSADSTEYTRIAHDNVENELSELPIGVCDDLDAQESSTADEKVDNELSELPVGVIDDLDAQKSSTADDKVENVLPELPLGVCEDFDVKEISTAANKVENVLSELPVGVCDDLDAQESSTADDTVEHVLSELPVGVCDDLDAQESSTADDKVENVLSELPVGVCDDLDAQESSTADDKVENVLSELPVGVCDDVGDQESSTADNGIEKVLPEVPVGVCDDLNAPESSSDETDTILINKGGEAEQGEDGSIEADFTLELKCDADDKENNEHMKPNEHPFSGVDTIPAEEADRQQENITSDVLETCEEVRDIPITKPCSKKDSSHDISSEATRVNNAKNPSMSDETTDQRTQEKEILVSVSEQEVNTANECANTHDASKDISETIQTHHSDNADEQGEEVINNEPPTMEPRKKNENKILLPKENLEDDNRKPVAENEKLREMMEKLIKSGQDQLMAISSLSGRVKDLEKKLSKRKKKLKTKQHRGGPKSASLIQQAV